MSEVETPKELLRRIYDEEFGFLPTNTSMKPVHLANGLARRVVGTVTDHVPLARVLRQYVGKGSNPEERNPNEAILADYGAPFMDRDGNPPSSEALTRFRALAKDTLGADQAVFPPSKRKGSDTMTAAPASFTLSHRRMITNDVSDNGAGDFVTGLLTAGTPPREGKTADLLRELLEDDTDPWTMIGWPLLGLAGEDQAATVGPTAQVRAERSAALLAVDEHGVMKSQTLRTLRDRFDQLAVYEKENGAKLTTLRRLVLLACFAIHVHMVRRAGDQTDVGARPPLLLDLFDGRYRSLREASAATLQAGFRSIEQLVLYRIRAHFQSACGEDADGFVSALPESPELDAVRTEYAAQRAGLEPLDALAESYWKTGYSKVGPEEAGGFPWNALLALGRRSGYLLPYDDRGRGGKEHKRYGINAEFAEVLVAATVKPGEPLDFDAFLESLRSSFGVVVGRPVDFDVIRKNDLRAGATLTRSVSVNEGDLRANLIKFRDLIVDIGFAKSYADGRTVVTTDRERH